MTAVRVRGIYATALTALLVDSFDVVQASSVIEDRFDHSFESTPATISIEDATDRTGISVLGTPGSDLQSVVTTIEAVGRDSFTWDDPTPPESVHSGRVTDIVRGGAVVDLGEREGFLPFADAETHLEAGDELTVQVAGAAAPWRGDRPPLRTTIALTNSYGRLVRGATNSSDGIDVTDLLSVSPRDGWTIQWATGATEQSFDLLDTALESLNDRARLLDERADRNQRPQRLSWVWFGRESRFALDEHRRSVTTTMDGHHRIKAGTDSASAAVNFTEAVAEPTGSFPFAETVRAFGPTVGDDIEIRHGKPDGRCFSLGTGAVTDRDGTQLTIERTMTAGGTYDALGVPKEAGDVAVTTLTEGKWWYPTVYRDRDGRPKGTYVNVCTPVELFPECARYVDLHVDVVKHTDDTVERVDDEELNDAENAGHIAPALADRARTVATSIERALGGDQDSSSDCNS